MKLLTAILMLLGSFALLAADFCVATPYSGTKSIKYNYHINCGQDGDRFLEKRSTKKSVARKNLLAEMTANGMNYIGTLPRHGQLLFSTSSINFDEICLAFPGSSDQNSRMDVFRIDCNDGALTFLYATPIKSKSFWSSVYLPNESGKTVLKQYMAKKNYSPLSTLEIPDSSTGYFSYIFQHD